MLGTRKPMRRFSGSGMLASDSTIEKKSVKNS
jgi:hypothetical protein